MAGIVLLNFEDSTGLCPWVMLTYGSSCYTDRHITAYAPLTDFRRAPEDDSGSGYSVVGQEFFVGGWPRARRSSGQLESSLHLKCKRVKGLLPLKAWVTDKCYDINGWLLQELFSPTKGRLEAVIIWELNFSPLTTGISHCHCGKGKTAYKNIFAQQFMPLISILKLVKHQNGTLLFIWGDMDSVCYSTQR